MSHLLAFLAGAATCFVVMLIDGVYGPIRLRRKTEVDEPGGGFG